ncbi:MAG: glycoside hydrolase family 3 protein [FCB group bacterium]|nr:glycoside hydrolase family 3 protein [FCB group bacterium]
MNSNLINYIGQLFIIGFPGEEPSGAFLNFLAEENIGGVILFRENCPTHQKTKTNIELIKSVYSSSVPFVAVDQEGGRVCRILGAPAEFPAATLYGEKFGLERFEEDYVRVAMYLESLGININLAPVCDIFLNLKNDCLKDRCFGKTAQDVIPFVKAMVNISQKSRLLSCLKHFPGLGAAQNDPHHKTAVADYDPITWEQREKLPFAVGVKEGAEIIMTTHVKLPQFDKQIATTSSKIVSQYLRQGLGFDGTVSTDDMTMKGLTAKGNIGEMTVQAFQAGHDLLLFGQNLELAMEAYEYFKDAYSRGDIDVERIKTSLNRIAGIKFKLAKSVSL